MLAIKARIASGSSATSNKKTGRTLTSLKRKSPSTPFPFTIHLARWRRKLSPKRHLSGEHYTETHIQAHEAPPATKRRTDVSNNDDRADDASDLSSIIYHTYPFRLVKYLHTHYFFDCEAYAWVPLRSLKAHEELATQLSDPYYTHDIVDDDESVHEHALAQVKAPLRHRHLCELFRQLDILFPSSEPSYCINGRRYKVSLEADGSLRSAPCPPLIPRTTPHDDWDDVPAFNSFAVAPLASNMHWDLWRPGCVTKAEDLLLAYFDHKQLELIRWFIGNGLCDPISRPRLLYVHARDAEHRKAITKALVAMLRGTVCHLDPERSITDENIYECIKARFLILGDLNLESMSQDKCAHLAALTSPTTAMVDNGAGQASCSAIASGEQLWSKKSHLQQAWFLSRVVVVTARSARTSISSTSAESSASSSSWSRLACRDWTMNDIAKFANNCIATRLKHGEDPPRTLDDALSTILGDDLSTLSRQRVVQRPNATPAESFEASSILSSECGVSRADIVVRLSCLSKAFVGEYLNTSTIKGIAPQPLSPRSQRTTITHNDVLDDWCLQQQREQQVEVTDYDYEAEYRRSRECAIPLGGGPDVDSSLSDLESSSDDECSDDQTQEGDYDVDESDVDSDSDDSNVEYGDRPVA